MKRQVEPHMERDESVLLQSPLRNAQSRGSPSRLKSLEHVRIGYAVPWLVQFLSTILRTANRSRLDNEPCSRPQCLYFDWGWDIDTDCPLRRRTSIDAVPWHVNPPSSGLEHLNLRIPTLQRDTGNGSQQKMPSFVALTVAEDQDGWSDLVQGMGGSSMPSHFRAGKRLDSTETRRCEQLAIVPYNNHVSLQLWETAMMVGYCAWKYYQSPEQVISPQAFTERKRSLEDTPTSDPQSPPPKRPHDEESGQSATPKAVETPMGTSAQAVEEGVPLKTPETSRRHGRMKRKDCMEAEEPLRRPKADESSLSSPPLDLSRVLLEEKSRRLKARAKEISMLQRFGLCKDENPYEEFVEEVPLTDPITETADIRERHPEEVRSSGPPFRCGSPSSLNRRLKRKRHSSVDSKKAENKGKLAAHFKGETSRPRPVPCSQGYETASPSSSVTKAVDKAGNIDCETLEDDLRPNPFQPSILDYDHESSSSKSHCDLSPTAAKSVKTEGPKELGDSSGVVAKRITPITYDEEGLTESARKMLQDIENKRFRRDDSAALAPGHHQAKQQDASDERLKLSKREKRKLRKEAKKKRKKAKREKKEKKSKRPIPPEIEPPPKSCFEGDVAQNSEVKAQAAVDSQVLRSNSIMRSKVPSSQEQHSAAWKSPPVMLCGNGETAWSSDNGRIHGNQTLSMDVSQDLSLPLNSVPQQLEPAPSALSARLKDNEYIVKEIEDNSSIQVLCSESFVEKWGTLIAKLASGSFGGDGRPRICVLDTPLVDDMGVDIESPAGGAIIVSLLSQVKREGFSTLLKRVVDVAAVSRYMMLEVVLCADDDFDSSFDDIARLQNATTRHNGTPATFVSFQLVSPSSLANCIADFVIYAAGLVSSESVPVSGQITEEWMAEDRTRERIRFLLSILPSVSVGKALQISLRCRSDGDESGWLQSLFALASDVEPPYLQGAVGARTLEQLAFALAAPLGTQA